MGSADVRAILLLALVGCQVVSSGRGGGTTPMATGAGPAGGGDPDGMITVPNVVGKSLDEAQAMAQQAGFKQDVETTRPVECDTPAPGEGLIRCQDPEAGTRVARYAMLQVNVYRTRSHKGRVTLEDLAALKGLTVAQARAKLVEYGATDEVEVATSNRFIDNCKPETICWAESGGGTILLYLNKQAAPIATPPSD